MKNQIHKAWLILVLLNLSYGMISFYNSSSDDTTFMYGLFDTPYANLDNGMEGYLYYYDDRGCDRSFPIPATNNSIVLVSNYSSTCILQLIALAKQAGYDGLLSYEEDNSNISVPNAIANTGFPFAIIESKFALRAIEGIESTSPDQPYSDYTVSVTGTILAGILIVSFACFCLLVSLCCGTIGSCLCCCYCLDRYEEHRIEQEYLGGGNRSREELVESILRHLQEMDDSINARTPLGANKTKNLPETRYVESEGKGDSCAICVDEFADGVLIKTLPCNHFFHSKCIEEWLTNYSSLCPLCKYNLRSDATGGPSTTGQVRSDYLDISSDDSSHESAGNTPVPWRQRPNYGTNSV